MNDTFIKILCDADDNIIKAFAVSDNMEDAKKEITEKIEPNQKEEKNNKEKNDSFEDILRNFSTTMETHFETSNLLLYLLGSARRLRDNTRIREYAEKYGEEVWTSPENNLEKIYKIPPKHQLKLFDNLQQSMNLLHGQKHLPGMLLSGLISSYDAFFADIIRVTLRKIPQIVEKSEKSITLDDLLTFESFDDAKSHIIEKQVDILMRNSHKKQIDWVVNKIHIENFSKISNVPDFIEICERRNIFTHTNGIVSKQYIGVCKENKIPTKFSIGDKAPISGSYYRSSVRISGALFIKLLTDIWCKIYKSDVDEIYSKIEFYSFNMIERKRYKYASDILSYIYDTCLDKQGIKESTKKRIIINYANSLKLKGDQKKAIEILEGHDWSAVTENYKICVAAIKGDRDYVIEKMKFVVESSKDITVENIKNWPVFISLRDDEVFAEAFENDFGEKIK